MRGFLRRRKENMLWTERPFECSRDGLTIRGVELRPEGTGLPAAIVCHGFMANLDTVRQYAETLAGLGYAAYMFDFCGGCVVRGRSDGKTTDMSVVTEVQDLESVMAHVRGLPYIDGGRLTLAGCSQGGFVCALTAARAKSGVERMILIYPALCIPDDARAGQMMFAKFDPASVPETFWCGPMKLGRRYVTDVIGMEPYREICGYQGDVLIIHGTADTLVKPEYSRRAQKAYRDARTGSGRVELKEIEGGGHGFSAAHDAEAMEAIRSFLTGRGSR